MIIDKKSKMQKVDDKKQIIEKNLKSESKMSILGLDDQGLKCKFAHFFFTLFSNFQPTTSYCNEDLCNSATRHSVTHTIITTGILMYMT